MVKRLKGVADYVNTLSDDVEKLTDAELRAKTDEFKKRVAGGETLDDLLPEAFAVAREAAWRVLSQRHFDVQVMGGAALHFGNVAEMKTGEGKTLTCVLPAYLNALDGKGVHVVTVNDYLAKRDSEWMGRVHRFLGLDVGVILAQIDARRAARRLRAPTSPTAPTTNSASTTCATTWRTRWRRWCSAVHNFAIVDEVDSILIDEARTPLIISGPADGASHWYTEFARIAPLMEKDTHYEVDLRKRTVGVHELGVEFVEDQLGIDNLYEAANSPLVSYLNNALKAKELFQRDKDYIVRNGEVLIVDEFTGRMLVGRRYNEGMHQAIEAKENVEIKAENQTLATITLQNYFRLYDKLAGMTGTAETEAAELHEIYKLGVVPDPDEPGDGPQGPDRPDLQDRGSQVHRRRRRCRRALREGPAGPDRHHQRRALGVPVAAVPEAARPAQRAQRQVPRAGGRHHRRGRPARRHHGGHQHGRPRYRHRARRQRRLPGSTSGCASADWTRSRPPTSTRRPGTRNCPRSRPRPPRRPRTSSPSAVSTCWAPNATSHAVSTTSCADAPDARATRVSRGSTCRWATSSCGGSTARRWSRC